MSCDTLKKIGHTKPGLYSLKSADSVQPRLGFCKMDEVQGYSRQGIEDFLGFWSLTSNAGGVFFSAYISSSYTNIGPEVKLTYNVIESNVGNGLQASEGTFTAPVSGHYLFEFSSLTGNLLTKSETYIYKNGNIVRGIRDSMEAFVNYNHVWEMHLAQNDQIYLYQQYGSLWSNSVHKITWSGQLLEQTEF